LSLLFVCVLEFKGLTLLTQLFSLYVYSISHRLLAYIFKANIYIA